MCFILPIRDQVHWSAVKGMNLRAMAAVKHVDLEEDYKSLYKTQSKFTHASPLIANMYRKAGGLRCIPSPEQSTELALLAIVLCMRTLEEFYEFLGIIWPAMEFALISLDQLVVQDILSGTAPATLEEAYQKVVSNIMEAQKRLSETTSS